MPYRSQSSHYYKTRKQYEKIKGFWAHYRTTKRIVGIIYDASAVLLIVLSLDKVYKYKSWRVIKAWQIAMLVEKLPKLVRTLRHHMTYGL